jgi:hypothetical protein
MSLYHVPTLSLARCLECLNIWCPFTPPCLSLNMSLKDSPYPYQSCLSCSQLGLILNSHTFEIQLKYQLPLWCLPRFPDEIVSSSKFFCKFCNCNRHHVLWSLNYLFSTPLCKRFANAWFKAKIWIRVINLNLCSLPSNQLSTLLYLLTHTHTPYLWQSLSNPF